MQVGQLRVTDVKLYLWYGTAGSYSSTCVRGRQLTGSDLDNLNRFYVIPGNGSLGKTNWQHMAEYLDRREYTQAAQQSAEADIDTDKPGRSLNLCQLEVINFDHAKPLSIHNLLIQNITTKQQFIRLWCIGSHARLL